MKVALAVAFVASIATGCFKQPPRDNAPVFQAGERWVIRYRDDAGVRCTLVIDVTKYVAPLLHGNRRSETCSTLEAGTWDVPGPVERIIDTSRAEYVERLEKSEDVTDTTAERVAGSCLLGFLSGVCTGL